MESLPGFKEFLARFGTNCSGMIPYLKLAYEVGFKAGTESGWVIKQEEGRDPTEDLRNSYRDADSDNECI